MLWLGLQLPALPLQVYGRGASEPFPLAVVERQAGRERVSICNETATQAGVIHGMPVATAQAILPALQLRARNPVLENRTLNRLAGWCGQYSSFVAIRPDGLVLEIGASLRLFKGLEALLLRLHADLTGLGYRFQLGVAPTPASAIALARYGGGKVDRRERLPAALAGLPLACLDLEPNARDGLRRMGIRDCDALLRLPSDGLARRFGPGLPVYLERLLGRCADPLAPYSPPERFAAQLSLPAESDQSEALLFPLRRLLLELCGFLRARQRGVSTLEVQLFHQRRAATCVSLNLVAASADAEYLLGLLRARFESLELQALVLEVGVSAVRTQPMAAENGDLFHPRTTGGEAVHQLPERLRARIGEQQVGSLGVQPDYRPELAWRQTPPGKTSALAPSGSAAGPRPVWLLPRPRLLRVEEGRPCYQGCLDILQGPERIESGWWDGVDVQRDYYVAADASGSRFWIYREPAGDWFLHGVFA